MPRQAEVMNTGASPTWVAMASQVRPDWVLAVMMISVIFQLVHVQAPGGWQQ